MDAIELLMNEHRMIERGIDALLAYADELRRQGADGSGGAREELGRFVTFLREFADARHHGKEEDILFATMVDAGFPRQGGPIAMMLMEHDLGRGHIRTLEGLATGAAPWTVADLGRIAEAAHAYGDLLRAHIHKEDVILYPMAEQHLAPEDMERVNAACEQFEARRTGGGQDEIQRLAEDLVARHAPGAPQAAASLHAHGCC